MTEPKQDPNETNPGDSADAADEGPPDSRDDKRADDDAVRALIKRSLCVEPPESAPTILPSVQKKLRDRSRGKFYGDGWSTVQSRLSYVLAAAITLTVAIVCYLLLGPHGIGH